MKNTEKTDELLGFIKRFTEPEAADGQSKKVTYSYLTVKGTDKVLYFQERSGGYFCLFRDKDHMMNTLRWNIIEEVKGERPGRLNFTEKDLLECVGCHQIEI